MDLRRLLVPAPLGHAGDRLRRDLIGAGAIGLLLWSGSLILVIQARTPSEHDSAAFRLFAAYLMWLLTLAALLLQVMLPPAPARMAATLAALGISFAVWLVDSRATEAVFVAGVGRAASRSRGLYGARSYFSSFRDMKVDIEEL